MNNTLGKTYVTKWLVEKRLRSLFISFIHFMFCFLHIIPWIARKVAQPMRMIGSYICKHLQTMSRSHLSARCSGQKCTSTTYSNLLQQLEAEIRLGNFNRWTNQICCRAGPSVGKVVAWKSWGKSQEKPSDQTML